MYSTTNPTDIAIIGAGPAGLIAADFLSAQPDDRGSRNITIYDRMRRPGRKFLLAGRGGLNLTNGDDLATFLGRYPGSTALDHVTKAVEKFTPTDLLAWAHDLGIETFTGTSGRIFPKELKASPMLRAWLARLDTRGVALATDHNWTGWSDDGALTFKVAGEPRTVDADITLLALGGASWPRMGSNGAWQPILSHAGIETSPLVASNCGFLVDWSPYFRDRFHGTPLKRVAVSVTGQAPKVRGDLVVTRQGLEGGPVYALGPQLRSTVECGARATLELDLRPDLTADDLIQRISLRKPKDSLSNTLRKRAGLQPVAINLLREVQHTLPQSPEALATHIKSLRLTITGMSDLDRAISSAGGVEGDAIAGDFSLRARPDVFVAGEMIDWDAPTGGYLLQACLATGIAAARGIDARLRLHC